MSRRKCLACAVVNLDQLRYVVATAEHGTMTAAAAACHVGQPALTRAVRSLERELGIVIFARSGRSVVLTAEGQEVVEHARHALASVDAIRRTRDRRVVLVGTPSLLSDAGAELAARVRADDPDLVVRMVRAGDPEEAADVVRSGAADLGVTDLIDVPSLARVPFARREVALLAPAAWDLPDPLPWSALATVPLIAPLRGGSRRELLDGLFRELGAPPQYALETDERTAWLPAIAAGVGACLWFRDIGERTVDPGVRMISLTPTRHREVALLHRPGPLPAGVASFVGAALETAAAS